MKDGFRQSMAWLHTWCGITVGWVLYFIFVTGTAGYFSTEIDRWMRPELPLSSAPMQPSAAVALALARIQAEAQDAEHWTITLPNRGPEPELRVAWRTKPGAAGTPGTTRTVYPGRSPGNEEARSPVERQTGGGTLLYQMHYRLHYIDMNTAAWLVGFCTMCMLVSILSGVITHKKIFRDFFTFRPRKGQRSWLDAHNVLAVLGLPFITMITYSGLVLLMAIYVPFIMNAAYGPDLENHAPFYDAVNPRLADGGPSGVPAQLTAIEPLIADAERDGNVGRLLAIRARYVGDANARIIITHQHDAPLRGNRQQVFDGVSGVPLARGTPERTGPWRVHDLLIGLHEGRYAGPGMRWLYFLLGLMGTAMVATGLVLWTVKRQERSRGTDKAKSLMLIERLNVGTLLGLPIGIAAYFHANRLLPVAFEGRGTWEAHVLFITWALTLGLAWLRPVRRAWYELSCCTAAAYALLPLTNWLASNRHLGVTLAHDHWRGEWSLAGFDLTMMMLGLLFAALAFSLRSKIPHSPALAQTPPGPPDPVAEGLD